MSVPLVLELEEDKEPSYARFERERVCMHFRFKSEQDSPRLLVFCQAGLLYRVGLTTCPRIWKRWNAMLLQFDLAQLQNNITSGFRKP